MDMMLWNGFVSFDHVIFCPRLLFHAQRINFSWSYRVLDLGWHSISGWRHFCGHPTQINPILWIGVLHGLKWRCHFSLYRYDFSYSHFRCGGTVKICQLWIRWCTVVAHCEKICGTAGIVFSQCRAEPLSSFGWWLLSSFYFFQVQLYVQIGMVYPDDLLFRTVKLRCSLYKNTWINFLVLEHWLCLSFKRTWSQRFAFLQSMKTQFWPDSKIYGLHETDKTWRLVQLENLESVAFFLLCAETASFNLIYPPPVPGIWDSGPFRMLRVKTCLIAR